MERGEFNNIDKKAVARTILFLLEGLRVSSEVMEITEGLVDEQFNYIKNLLINKTNIKY
ncbi:MAG: hypothetical protein GX308_02895 [Epulopiscium sp.]|nr:hypothetical protein [Candidatus Epulonipiscium sp.]